MGNGQKEIASRLTKHYERNIINKDHDRRQILWKKQRQRWKSTRSSRRQWT